MELTLSKLADISTAHLSINDRNALSYMAKNPGTALFTVTEYEYGYLLIMGDRIDWADTKKRDDRAILLSKEFWTIFDQCVSQDVDLIRFDTEGWVVDGWKYFDI